MWDALTVSEDRSRIAPDPENVELVHVYLAADLGRRDDATFLANALTATQSRIRIVSRWHAATAEDEINAAERGPSARWQPERAVEVATRNTADIERCDSLVLLTTGEPSRGGRHFETGYAIALGKPVLMVGPPEHAFQHLPGIRHADSHDPAEIAEVICRWWGDACGRRLSSTSTSLCDDMTTCCFSFDRERGTKTTSGDRRAARSS